MLEVLKRLSIVILIYTSLNLSAVESNIVDKKAMNAVTTLNYIHSSLNKITIYNNKIILEQEYDNIINNINLSVIDDAEIIDIITNLMDTLTQYKLTEMEKNIFKNAYKKKIENALNNILLGTSSGITKNNIHYNTKKGIHIAGVITNPIYIIKAVNNYYNIENKAKEELNQETFRLKKSTLKELNKIRKKFIITYWKMMKKYNIPDKWRVSEKQFNRFINILKVKDNEKKLRMLLRLKEELAVSPTYWFELALASHNMKDKGMLFYAISKYEALNVKILRYNSQYSLMLANKITYLNAKNQQDIILKLLKKIEIVDPLNPEMKLFSAMQYALMGDSKTAEKLLNENIDDDFLPFLNQKMKLKLYMQNKDEKSYKRCIDKILIRENISIIEYLSFLGDSPIKVLVTRIDKELKKININIDKSIYGKDTLVVQVPRKWVYTDTSKTDIILKLNMIESRYTDLVDENSTISYRFEDVIKYNDLKDKKIKNLSLKIIYKDLPIYISYNIEIIKPNTKHIEKEHSSDDSILNSSISYFNNAKATIYNESQDVYSDYNSKIKFIVSTITLKNKCFNALDSLAPCSK